MREKLVWAPLILGIGCAAPPPQFGFPTCVDAGDKVELDREVTWSADVAPIVFDNCVPCHRAGGVAPFVLSDYDSASAWAKPMKQAVMNRTMPPPGPTSCGECQSFENLWWLEPEEIATLRQWADTEMPAGDLSKVPELPDNAPVMDRVDASMSMAEPYTPDATVPDDLRCFLLDPELSTDRFLTAFEVVPGEPLVVHHVILYALTSDTAVERAQDKAADHVGLGYPCFGGPGVEDNRMVAAWVPGVGPTYFPDRTGIRLGAGRQLVLQIHYNLGNGPLPDQSQVNLKLEDKIDFEATIVDDLVHDTFELEPGQTSVQSEFTMDEIVEGIDDMTIWGVLPHMHTLGTTLTVEAWDKDHYTCLADVAQWDFNWQGLYFYEEPVLVRGSDNVRIRCGWNTEAVSKPVFFGDGTEDEMCLAFFYATEGPPP